MAGRMGNGYSARSRLVPGDPPTCPASHASLPLSSEEAHLSFGIKYWKIIGSQLFSMFRKSPNSKEFILVSFPKIKFKLKNKTVVRMYPLFSVLKLKLVHA